MSEQKIKRKAKKPYSQRTDVEKVCSNWRKTLGLFERGEYSVAIIRAATTVELAANLVIRAELIRKRDLPSHFVDKLLTWANGLNGKIRYIISPICRGRTICGNLKKLQNEIESVSKERNSIVHSGQFKKKDTARKTIEKAHTVVVGLVKPYERNFDLPELSGRG